MNMTKNFATYLGWATIQHAFVLLFVYGLTLIFGEDGFWQIIVATLIFGSLHIPNYPLVCITLLGGIITYYFVFGLGLWTMAIFIPIHAFFGTSLKNMGFEMRVLWNYPSSKK